MKAAHWVLDGPVSYDAGDIGGDIQVGPAISARFRSDDCPEARFEVVAYATAKPYTELNEDPPPCPHTEPPGWVCKNGWQEDHGPDFPNGTRCVCWLPPEHMACSWKPGTVDVQEQITYRMNGRMVNGFYESDDTDPMAYDWVGSAYNYPGKTLTEQINNATDDAKKHIEQWVEDPNGNMCWDGRTVPQY